MQAALELHPDRDLDYSLIKANGLKSFVELAFPVVEPSTELLWNWHIDAICEHLEAVTYGQIKNLLILVPPGSMKTLLVSIMWPAWEWTVKPGSKFVYTSYAQDLSNKIAWQSRELIKSPWYQDLFGGPSGVQITADHIDKVHLFYNNHGGFRFSTAVGGPATGFHGNRVIYDDLTKTKSHTPESADLKASHTHWFNTLETREANPKDLSRVGIQQRVHEADVAGECIKSGDYEVLCLPMEYDPARKCVTRIFKDPRKKEGQLLWPNRWSKSWCERKRRVMGSMAYSAQMQQSPAPSEGAIFKRFWAQYYTPGEFYLNEPNTDSITHSWDCAFKDAEDSSYVCGQVWAQKGANHYLLDRIKEHLDVVGTMRAIEMMREKWGGWETLIEDKANGTAVIQMLRDKIGGIISLPRPGEKMSSKESRAYSVTPIWESGNVYLPKGAAWLDDFEHEVFTFPASAHNDQVDAMTQYLNYKHGHDAAGFLEAITNSPAIWGVR